MKNEKIGKLILTAIIPLSNTQVQAREINEFQLNDVVLTFENYKSVGINIVKVKKIFDGLHPNKNEERKIFFLDPHIENKIINVSDLDGITIDLPLDLIKFAQPRNFREMM